MTSDLQRGMSDFQQYPLHLCLIQDFIDILIHKARNFHVTLSVPELNIHLYKWEYLPHCCLHKGLKGTIVNWTCHLKLCLQLGFPPEFRVKVYIQKWSRNFFHFRKFPERYFGISGTFRKFSGKIVSEISGTIGIRIKLKPLRLMYRQHQ